MSSKKYLYVLGCLVTSFPALVWAQGVSPGSVQKSSELIIKPTPVLPKSDSDMGAGDLVSFDKLAKVYVKSNKLVEPINGYWASRLGKSVTVEDVIDFKIWVTDLAKNEGFLAYPKITSEVGFDGSENLIVDLIVPTVKSVKIYVPNAELANRFQALLVKRFSDAFKIGSSIDLQSLDQLLEVVGYDLPVELEVFVRTAGVEEVDITINAERIKDKPGQFLNGLLQVNNFGLKSYGRPQLVGSFGFAGYTPKSTFVLTSQLSEGVQYGRAEYEAPVQAINGRVKSWLSLTDSHTILGGAAATTAKSREVGLGFSRMLRNVDAYLIQSSLDFSDRKTESYLRINDQELSSIEDAQIKLHLNVSNDRVSRDSNNLDVYFIAGHYRNVRGDLTPAGFYGKVELSAKSQRTLSFDGRSQGLLKLRAQAATQNLDGYNRMALGGMNGVRAYTSADGVGDNGIQLTAELNQRLDNGKSMGIFYDAGMIRPNRNPLSGVLNEHYTLQAIGMQWAGNFQRWYYNASLAKGIGPYKKSDVGEPTESRSHALRLNFSMSYIF